jgi:serine/threonine-protein phosphatase 6 regulatory ankyrin repeat subunit A/serine/threonine-protein phosphatase 6 regulatory ankyrin repeat subunit B
LLDAGASTSASNDDHETPLHTSAAAANADEIVPWLLAHRPPLDQLDVHGRTALIGHAQEGRLGAVRALVEAGAAIDTIDLDGQNALFSAASHGHLEITRLLLEHGGDPDVVNRFGADAVLAAANAEDRPMVALLLAHGAHATTAMPDGTTALAIAIQHDDLAMVRLLLPEDAPLDREIARIGAPLHVAAYYGADDVAAYLLERHAALDASADGFTPLMYAVIDDHVDVATRLVAAGASTTVDREGATLLHFAAFAGSLGSVQLLVEHGMAVDVRNLQGGTALRSAADAGHTEIVAYLLAHHADPSVRDDVGLSPLDYARRNGHADVAALLAPISAPSTQRESPLAVGHVVDPQPPRPRFDQRP